MYGWGYNIYSQVGDGSTSIRYLAAAVVITGSIVGKTIISVSAGAYNSYALASDGSVHSWGDKDHGERGASVPNIALPVAVDLTSVSGKVTTLAGGNYAACLVSNSSNVYAWGTNAEGELGVGNALVTTLSTPTSVVMTGVLSGMNIIGVYSGPSSLHRMVIALPSCFGKLATDPNVCSGMCLIL
jgi:alpha-tubulin suppressor-like RCC1 family protein